MNTWQFFLIFFAMALLTGCSSGKSEKIEKEPETRPRLSGIGALPRDEIIRLQAAIDEQAVANRLRHEKIYADQIREYNEGCEERNRKFNTLKAEQKKIYHVKDEDDDWAAEEICIGTGYREYERNTRKERSRVTARRE